jgi:hypothetical protein
MAAAVSRASNSALIGVVAVEPGERLPAQHLLVRDEVRGEPGRDRAAGRGRHHVQRLHAQRGALGRVR